MKMKSLFILLIGACSLVVSACNNSNSIDQTPSNVHEHTFSTSWTYDDTFHWHSATCEHTNLVSNKEQHKYGSWIIDIEATEYEKV